MKKEISPREQLVNLFEQKKCWTISQLSEQLDYAAVSVKRFLRQVGYSSSFTHNGKWYTLHGIPDFDEDGLWFYEGIGFSRHGNLKKTLLHLVTQSPLGLSAGQLSEKLSSPRYDVLNHMYKAGRIDRLKTPRGFVYLATDPGAKKQQIGRLQTFVSEQSKPGVLTAQAAVYVLAEFIKHPQASFAELSRGVAKKQVMATPEMIAQLFEEHDLKKTLR